MNARGQAMMEYILISSLVGLFCLVSLKQFGSVLEKRMDSIKSKVVENMKSK